MAREKRIRFFMGTGSESSVFLFGLSRCSCSYFQRQFKSDRSIYENIYVSQAVERFSNVAESRSSWALLRGVAAVTAATRS